MPAIVTSAVIARERRGDAAAAAADVVVVHRLDEHDVGVRVEAARELVAVVLEVRLDRVAAAARAGPRRPEAAAEPVVELELGAVADLADAAGDRTCPRRGPSARRRSSRRREVRVGPDRADLQRAQTRSARPSPRRRPRRTISPCDARRGCATAHSSARMPPIDPPTTRAPTRRCRARRRARPPPPPDRAVVMTGKRLRTGGRRGSIDDGPVVPWHPPSTFGHDDEQRVGVDRLARADDRRATSRRSRCARARPGPWRGCRP